MTHCNDGTSSSAAFFGVKVRRKKIFTHESKNDRNGELLSINVSSDIYTPRNDLWKSTIVSFMEYAIEYGALQYNKSFWGLIYP